MYIGREDEKNILSYVHFTRLFNIIIRFLELNIGILKEVITSTPSFSARAYKWRKSVITFLRKYVNQIDTRIYGE